MLNKVMVKRAIGRELMDAERQTVEWINGWEKQTGLNLMGLIHTAREHGYAEGVRDSIKSKGETSNGR